MELSFIFDAVRRYLWIVVMFAVLGSLPALAIQLGADAEFESRAVLLVVPARDARVQINVTNENERYVLGQLAVLQSRALAERVAVSLDDGTTASALLSTLSLNHIPETDIVEVVVRTPVPERSSTIADAYVDAYVASLSEPVDIARSPEIGVLDDELSDIRERLSTVDGAIGEAMAPFLVIDGDPTGSRLQQIPTPAQVVPSLVSEQQILLTEYDQALTARNELQRGSVLRVSTEVIERATTPLDPIGGRGGLLMVAGALVGGFLGVLSAVILARLSSRVASRRSVEEMLGGPMLGPVSFPRFDRHGLATVSQGLTSGQHELVDALRIRAEADAPPGAPLLVVVAGAESCGTVSPLAAALAARWAVEGVTTLLIDANFGDPSISRELAPDRPGIHELLHVESGENASVADVATPTKIHLLAVVGPGSGRGPFRRQDAEWLVASASGTDVIVIDVGGLMESTAGLQFAAIADMVVLVVSHRARTSSVKSAQRYLANSDTLLLPVWSQERRRRHGKRNDAPGGTESSNSEVSVPLAEPAPASTAMLVSAAGWSGSTPLTVSRLLGAVQTFRRSPRVRRPLLEQLEAVRRRGNRSRSSTAVSTRPGPSSRPRRG